MPDDPKPEPQTTQPPKPLARPPINPNTTKTGLKGR